MICNQKESDYENLLNHTEVCCLSIGRALKIAIEHEEDLFLYKKTRVLNLLIFMISGC